MNENNTLNRVSDIKKVDQKVRMLTLLGDKVQQLQNNLEPQNDSGSPLAYIDPQVVLEFITTNQEVELTQTEINIATIDIDYLEGFPVVEGLPFWERLDCEPIDYYKMFKLYRNQKITDSTRSFEKLIDQLNNTTAPLLHALSKVYHWQQRVRAFDQYQGYLVEKEREKLTTVMNGRHQKTAEKMWELCEKYLTELASKPDKMLSFKPAEFKSLLVEARKLERLSLGLPGDRPPTTPNTQNTEITNIKIDSKIKNESKTINLPSGEKVKYLQEIVDVLHNANALPKTIEAQGDVQEETEKGDSDL